MKIRSGFVSNSSSSSFIILGVPSNESIEKEGIESLYVEGEDGDYINGYIIADYDPYEGDFGEISSVDLHEKIEFIANTLEVEPNKVKLIYGVRPS